MGLTLRRAALGVALLAATGLAAAGMAGEWLTQPAHRTIGPAPAALHARAVSFATVAGEHVAGWFVPGRHGAGVVLLLHGVRADRREMLGRAAFLAREGYAVLLIDLPAHGESDGDRITFGHREAQGVDAALDYLARMLPGERVGVIGVSLGGASLALAQRSHAPSAMVFESVFPTIDEAVADRLKIYLGPVGPALAPVLLSQLPVRLGFSAAELRPIDALAHVQAPLFVIAGGADRHTTRAETLRMFAAAQEPKRLWIIEPAAHVDLHAFAPQAYEARVGAFLAQYLRPAG